MTGLILLAVTFVSILLTFCSDIDLQTELTAAGITAVFPGDPSYAVASKACEFPGQLSRSTTLTWSESQSVIHFQTCGGDLPV